MFVLSNFLSAITDIFDWLLTALQIAVLARVVFSWVNADPYNGIVRAVGVVTEPLLRPFRRIFPPWRLNGLDISPICVFLVIFFIRKFAITTLWEIAARLK